MHHFGRVAVALLNDFRNKDSMRCRKPGSLDKFENDSNLLVPILEIQLHAISMRSDQISTASHLREQSVHLPRVSIARFEVNHKLCLRTILLRYCKHSAS